MLPEPTILNSVARVVADALQAQGVEPGPVFAAAGLHLADLRVPRGRYGFERHQRLWRAAAAATGDACLGLRVGERVRPTSFGVLGVAWLASGSLRDALHRLCRYSRVLSTAPHSLVLLEGGEPCWLRYDYPPAGLVAPEVSVVALLVAVVTLARMVARPDLSPREVRFRHAGNGQAQPLEQFFGCTVSFGAPFDGLAFDPAELDAPLVGHEPEIAREGDLAAEGYLRAIDAPEVAAEVRRVLVGLLPSGEADLDRVAGRLNRGLSTLQRQRQAEGLTYRAVLDDTRRRLAEGYLADRRLSLSEIAFLVGFADQSCFSRSFRRWTGLTPRQFRHRLNRP